MKEEERKRRLQIIEQKYLEAKSLKEVKYQTKTEIINQEMRMKLPSCDCPHDVCYYIGEYVCLGDIFWPVTHMEQKVEYYSYYCLDCCSKVNVSVGNIEVFLKNHYVIETSKPFDVCRGIYCDLLCTNHADTAYKKLQKRLTN